MQSHIHPSMDMPLLSAMDRHPRLLLGEQGACVASSSSFSSLDWVEGRTPRDPVFCLEVPVLSEEEVAFVPPPPRVYPPAFLISGPKPGATSKCRLLFLRAPGTALSHLF